MAKVQDYTNALLDCYTNNKDANLISDSAKSKEALLTLKNAQAELSSLTHSKKKACTAKNKGCASSGGSSVAQNLVALIEDSAAPSSAIVAPANPGPNSLDFNNPCKVALH